MDSELQKKIQEALKDPKNMGELADADSVGTVGNSECGEMLRMWVKYREERGRRVIDKATFQSFGCETAIAVASMATEMIKGKTADEAMALAADDLTGDLGALPPMKIHCAELVEGALRSALEGGDKPCETPTQKQSGGNSGNLIDSFASTSDKGSGVKVVFLSPDEEKSE